MKLGQTSAIHFVSNVVASILSFVAVILFARILGADILGQYYLVLALLAWLKIGGRIGVSSALIKRLSEGSEKGEYTAAGAILILMLFVILALGILAFDGYVNDYVGTEVALLLVFMLFSTQIYSFFSAVLKGNHLVHISGVLAPIRITIRSLLQIGAVIAGLGLAGLLAGYAIGWIVAGAVALVVLVPSFSLPSKRHFMSLFEYAKYAWLGMVQSRTFNWIDVIVLGFFVPTGQIGVYSVAWSIAVFLLKFSHSVSSSIFPEISQLASEGKKHEVARILDSAIAYTGLILIPGLVGGLLLSDRLLRIYGEEFSMGSVVLVVLIVGVLIYSYQKPLLTTVNGLDRPDIAFRVNAVFVVTNIILNVTLIYLYGLIGAAIATALSAAISLALAYYYLSSLVDFTVPYVEIARQWIAALLMGGVVYGGLWIENTYRLLAHNFATVIILVGIGAGVYFLALLAISAQFRRTVSDNLPIDGPLLTGRA
ncbi:oligosaccharide flippase family protein [Halalkaliarchaeum sp. AArc-GB]|uniref:oligosaccharide flippase family protein n=1 Tax=Halalkaliarchaeum sp. AArc-GB TaxID=3074078 RepID=UPI002860A988|nr:oligosaccharide flippase family protein [Halalkaliarchaeum sp. AArc-GB]MDR5674233.1 oligosaccharide flippase family protein [Halalkaliarchaeum sp. AArc-GB]